MLEIHVGGPVVGEVVGKSARGAGGNLGDVCRRHRSVEGVLQKYIFSHPEHLAKIAAMTIHLQLLDGCAARVSRPG